MQATFVRFEAIHFLRRMTGDMLCAHPKKMTTILDIRIFPSFTPPLLGWRLLYKLKFVLHWCSSSTTGCNMWFRLSSKISWNFNTALFSPSGSLLPPHINSFFTRSIRFLNLDSSIKLGSLECCKCQRTRISKDEARRRAMNPFKHNASMRWKCSLWTPPSAWTTHSSSRILGALYLFEWGSFPKIYPLRLLNLQFSTI